MLECESVLESPEPEQPPTPLPLPHCPLGTPTPALRSRLLLAPTPALRAAARCPLPATRQCLVLVPAPLPLPLPRVDTRRTQAQNRAQDQALVFKSVGFKRYVSCICCGTGTVTGRRRQESPRCHAGKTACAPRSLRPPCRVRFACRAVGSRASAPACFSWNCPVCPLTFSVSAR